MLAANSVLDAGLAGTGLGQSHLDQSANGTLIQRDKWIGFNDLFAQVFRNEFADIVTAEAIGCLLYTSDAADE